MFYTLGEAAKATGVTKPTLSKAIKSGKISAIKNENGSYSIDPAELHRVFPAVSGNREEVGIALRMETPLQLAEILAKEQQERARERLQQEATINDLRRRLDEEATERRQSAEEIRRLTLLLTHQPEATTRKAGRSGLWLALLLALLASAGAGLFGYWWTMPPGGSL